MFGIATALVGLHVTGKYRNRSMKHTCSRHAAWDPHNLLAAKPKVRVRSPQLMAARHLCTAPGAKLDPLGSWNYFNSYHR